MQDIDKEACINITDSLRNHHLSFIFDLPEKNSEYYSIIKNPIDFNQIIGKLRDGHYNSIEEWKYDMNMVWLNLTTYQSIDSCYAEVASLLQKRFDQLVKEHIKMRDTNFWNREIVRMYDKIENLLEAAPDVVWMRLDKMIHKERPNSFDLEKLDSIIKGFNGDDKLALLQVLSENHISPQENRSLSNYSTPALCSIIYYLRNRKK